VDNLYGQIAEAIYAGDEAEAEKLAQAAIEAGVDLEEAIQKGGIAGLDRLSVDYDNLVVFLPELMMAADAMKAFLKVLEPHLAAGRSSDTGTVVIGCAKGDLHDIGKDLVRTQLAVNGFNVVDLGVDVSTNEFIKAAQDNKANIIAISSLLTTSAYYMGEMISNLKEDGIRDQFKIIVGGGPINDVFAESIGADGYSKTAFGAVEVCKKLIKSEPGAKLIVVE